MRVPQNTTATTAHPTELYLLRSSPTIHLLRIILRPNICTLLIYTLPSQNFQSSTRSQTPPIILRIPVPRRNHRVGAHMVKFVLARKERLSTLTSNVQDAKIIVRVQRADLRTAFFVVIAEGAAGSE